MLPSLFAFQVTNYRVAQGLTTMKTSPVVLPHCVLSHVLAPLGRVQRADLRRGLPSFGAGLWSSWATKRYRTIVHLVRKRAVATRKSISRAKLRAKQTPTSRSCVDKEITWVIEIFLAVMTS